MILLGGYPMTISRANRSNNESFVNINTTANRMNYFKHKNNSFKM